MRIHYPKLCNMTRSLSLNVSTAFKEAYLYILFVITAANVASCGCRKVSPYITHRAEYYLCFFFEISRNILGILKNGFYVLN